MELLPLKTLFVSGYLSNTQTGTVVVMIPAAHVVVTFKVTVSQYTVPSMKKSEKKKRLHSCRIESLLKFITNYTVHSVSFHFQHYLVSSIDTIYKMSFSSNS